MKHRLQSYAYSLLLICCVTTSVVNAAPADKSDKKADTLKWQVNEPQGKFITAQIDTDESTWSSVDISPDGKTIVFDMLGDIYTIPASGGEATAISQGISWDTQPVFSPDGAHIAFVSDRSGGDNIWLMNADGSDPKAVSTEKTNLAHDPDWSPDGQYIVSRKGFTSTRSKAAGEVWVFHRKGGKGLQLIKRPHGKKDQKDRGEATYSTDGRYVYFSADATSGQRWKYNKNPTGEVFVIKRLDRQNGKVETIADGPGGAIRPAISNDGKLLAFIKRVDTKSVLHLKDLTSGKQWPIYPEMDRDLQETSGNHGMYPKFSWTPDDKAIVFWAGGKIRQVNIKDKSSKVIAFHVKNSLKIQQALRFNVDVAPDTFDVKMIRWAQVSPKGDKLVFSALGHLYIQDYPKGKPKRLTKQQDHFEFYPAFSSDGRSIVYTTWDDQKLGSIAKVSVRGGRSKTLTKAPGHYIEPKFSPDGNSIVYTKVGGGYLLSADWSMDQGIYAVSLDGGKPVRLSQEGFSPHFGDSNKSVFFSESAHGAGMMLKSVNIDGHQERTHLKGAKVTEFAVSPDGRWVGFTEQFNAYITPFHLTGQTVDVSSEGQALPVAQVAKASGEYLHWSAKSDELRWSLGSEVFTRKLKEAFAFIDGAPDPLPKPASKGVRVTMQRQADKPKGLVAFKRARIITMKGDEVIENGVLIVQDNRIIAVGDANTTIPKKAKIVDVNGKTIIPGLVDVHAHGSQGRYEVIPEQNWRNYSSLAFGVTTIHDPSNDTSEIFTAAEMVKSGQLVGPRIFSTGTILYGAKGPGYAAAINSLEDARFHVKRLKDVGAISVKSYNQPRRDQRQQVIQAGREMGMMVVPEGGAKVQHNMNMIVDGHTGVEHALPVEKFYADLEQLWSQSETGYTPTLGVAYGGLKGETYWYDRTEVWKNERLLRYTPRTQVEPLAIRRPTAPDSHYNHFAVAQGAKTLMDLGVSVQLGAHGQREGLAAHWELWMFEQGGMTPLEAIRVGTLNGAKYLGMDKDIGSLEVGKLADLVVIDGNVLSDLKRSEYVQYTMINGRLYDAATMNEVVTGKRQRQPFFFADKAL